MPTSSKKQEKPKRTPEKQEWVSIREIGEMLGVSYSTAKRRVATLRAAGLGNVRDRYPLCEVRQLLEDWSHGRNWFRKTHNL